MRKHIICLLIVALSLPAIAQTAKGPTDLRGILLQQLRTVHNEKDWFVPANTAVQGMTAEQARWTDGKGNHSVGQLAYHLVFWNMRDLAKFRGQEPVKFSGENDETFNDFDGAKWNEVVRQLDQGLTEWEKAVQTADDKKLQAWASTISHISMHNAYHIGQILYVRKLQGSWNPDNGVK